MRAYGRLAVVTDASSYERLVAELSRYLQEAEEQQDRLSELLRADPTTRPVGWPLRGELISDLDRLRSELQAGSPAAALRIRRERSWRRPLHAGRRQRRSPTRRRPEALPTVRGGLGQAERFLKRIDRPEKNWRFAPIEVRECAYWSAYQRAFTDMLSATSAPWRRSPGPSTRTTPRPTLRPPGRWPKVRAELMAELTGRPAA